MPNSSDKNVSFWENEFSELEKLVVAGEHEMCRERLDRLSLGEMSRELAPCFAQLASRVHHSIFAMKLLYQYVFPENSFAQAASVQEKSVYAYALLNLGASKEALELLESIDASLDPEVLLQKALAHFKDWNYLESIPILEEFIAAQNLSPYRKLVGQVNLAAAYISLSRWSPAHELLQFIEKQCLAGDYQLLLGNSYELQAQVHFFQKKYPEAIRCLEKGIEILKNQKGLYLVFVEKWMTICRCFEAASQENLEQLRSMRDKAYLANYWETARECDLFEGILTQDESLVRKVLMGTPSENYRYRARQLYGKTTFRRSGEYSLFIQGASQIAEVRNFNPYRAGPDGARLSEKRYLLAMFEALTSDFYKPSYLGALFKTIYPDEKFNPSNSPQRVLQLLKRLNLWFKDHGWPLSVQFKKSEFSLKSKDSIFVTIHRGKKITDLSEQILEVRKTFIGRSFSAVQLAKVLGLSKTAGHQVLKKLLSGGVVISIGKGRGSYYQFSSRRNLKRAA